MTQNRSDRRVRKTKQQLRQGLVSLMRRKNIQDITVTELCTQCDINRSTFYLHYTDVYQLLKSIEEDLMEELENKLDDLLEAAPLADTHPSPAMCGMFEMLADNADMCRVLLCDNADMAFVEQVKELVRIRVLSGWGSMFRSSISYDYVNAFMVSGCIGMLQCWLEKDMPVSPKTMAAMVEGLLIRGISVMEE